MTKQHSPDDEETSVFPAIQQPATTRAPTPPSVMPPVSPYIPPGAIAPPMAMPGLYPPYRPAPTETSGRAGLAALILIIFGLTEAVLATLGAIFASTLRRTFDQLLRDQGIRIEAQSLTGVLTATFLSLLLLGVLQMVAAGGVLGHKRWGRWLGVLLSLAGVAAGGWLLYRAAVSHETGLANLTLPLLILVPYGICLLGLLLPGSHFGRRWPGR